jgi:hypothetical protein
MCPFTDMPPCVSPLVRRGTHRLSHLFSESCCCECECADTASISSLQVFWGCSHSGLGRFFNHINRKEVIKVHSGDWGLGSRGRSLIQQVPSLPSLSPVFSNNFLIVSALGLPNSQGGFWQNLQPQAFATDTWMNVHEAFVQWLQKERPIQVTSRHSAGWRKPSQGYELYSHVPTKCLQVTAAWWLRTQQWLSEPMTDEGKTEGFVHGVERVLYPNCGDGCLKL